MITGGPQRPPAATGFAAGLLAQRAPAQDTRAATHAAAETRAAPRLEAHPPAPQEDVPHLRAATAYSLCYT